MGGLRFESCFILDAHFSNFRHSLFHNQTWLLVKCVIIDFILTTTQANQTCQLSIFIITSQLIMPCVVGCTNSKTSQVDVCSLFQVQIVLFQANHIMCVDDLQSLPTNSLDFQKCISPLSMFQLIVNGARPMFYARVKSPMCS